MRPNLYGMTATALLTLTSLPAQNMNALAVHFPQPTLAGGRLLSAGNYTLSTMRGTGEVPILRFQNEVGYSIAVMVTRDYLALDELVQRSEVMVVVEGDTLRVLRVAMEGLPFQFIIADLSD